MKYIHRVLEKPIRKYLSSFPAVAITGPRQSGKSTILKQIFGMNYKYVTFDDPLVIERLKSDPKDFISEYSNKIIFDEVQRAPELFHYLKMEIDKDRGNYGKFILTGSSQFSFIKNITETLAGRIGMLALLPFQRAEVPKKLQNKQILLGSYPELVGRNYKNAREWYAAYLRNYLERDVRSLANIGNIRDFQRLISLLATRTAQELNMSQLSRIIGVSVKTIQNWISILEASYIIFLLQPYHNNLGKRIVKRPKLYFYDTGLVCYLTGIRTAEVLKKGPLQGEIFETYVISEITKTIMHRDEDIALYYFRDNLGLEADLIIENRTKNNICFVEIKNSRTMRTRMAQSLKALIGKRADRFSRTNGYILYKGKETGTIFKSIQYKNYADSLDTFANTGNIL